MTGVIPAAKPIIGDEERIAVDSVLASGGLAQGPQVAAFETEFSDVVGGRECVAVNSGTSALHMALIALGIGSGDEVIVPSFTFAATANAVALAGATPVFVDIEAALSGVVLGYRGIARSWRPCSGPRPRSSPMTSEGNLDGSRITRASLLMLS